MIDRGGEIVDGKRLVLNDKTVVEDVRKKLWKPTCKLGKIIKMYNTDVSWNILQIDVLEKIKEEREEVTRDFDTMYTNSNDGVFVIFENYNNNIVIPFKRLDDYTLVKNKPNITKGYIYLSRDKIAHYTNPNLLQKIKYFMYQNTIFTTIILYSVIALTLFVSVYFSIVYLIVIYYISTKYEDTVVKNKDI